MITDRKKDTLILKAAFYKVFSNNTFFGKMFVPSISNKVLLCPTEGFCLSKKQFSALIHTLQKMGELSYYFSDIEEQTPFSEDSHSSYSSKHYELSITTEYDEYEKIPSPLENALYSSSGKWGILVSHEDFAVLGGTNEFVTLFKKNYPEWAQDTNNFIEMWNSNKEHYGSDISWIADFLKYING